MSCSIDDCVRPVLSRGMCEVHYARNLRHGDPRTTLIKSTPKGAAAKLFESLFLANTSECVVWPYARNKGGYAVFDGRVASRTICARINGKPPTGAHQAAHSCGNGHLGCVNPEHLSWKTPKGNQADRKVHGTYLSGERVPGSKLTEDDIRSIRNLYQTRNMSQAEISKAFGVAQGIISGIISRKRWRHVA